MKQLFPEGFDGINKTLLANARIPAVLFAAGAPEGAVEDGDGAVLIDLIIDQERIGAISPAGRLMADHRIDLAGRHLWPKLVDVHAHLDKGHIVDRATNPYGNFAGARDATAADRTAHWRRDDLLRRMNFGLGCAQAHGVAAIRTHLDSHEGQAEETWATFSEIRDLWSARVTLQAVALAPIDIYRTGYGRQLADLVSSHGGILGGVTRSSGGNHGDELEDIDGLLDSLFSLARERNLDVDLHVDEAAIASALPHVARATIRNGYEGRVTCGHCCSLALLSPEEAADIMALVRQAGISIVTLPTVNMYLQDRNPGITPRWRGVTPVHELIEMGIRVAAAGDNCRDPFYAYGDHDMLDTFRQSVRILHLDHPVNTAAKMVGPVPAEIMGLGEYGSIDVGRPANLMILEAWSMDQVIARPQSDRLLLNAGRPSDVAIPSYLALGEGPMMLSR